MEFDIVIITAADDEDSAVRDVREGIVGSWERVREYDAPLNLSWHATYQSTAGGVLKCLLVRAPAQGGDSTASTAQSIIERFQPRVLAMCGVCAGDPDKTQLGDVIVADALWRYDFGKLNGSREFLHETRTHLLNYEWTSEFKVFEKPNHVGWPDDIAHADWKIRLGAMATGSFVNEDIETWKRLQPVQRKTVAIEMEGAALGYIGYANTPAEGSTMPILVIKGVMDNAGPRNDDSRAFAARAAAEVLIKFVRENLRGRGANSKERTKALQMTFVLAISLVCLFGAEYIAMPIASLLNWQINRAMRVASNHRPGAISSHSASASEPPSQHPKELEVDPQSQPNSKPSLVATQSPPPSFAPPPVQAALDAPNSNLMSTPTSIPELKSTPTPKPRPSPTPTRLLAEPIFLPSVTPIKIKLPLWLCGQGDDGFPENLSGKSMRG